VVTSADVQEVLVRGGKAVGVRLADGREIMANLVGTSGQQYRTSRLARTEHRRRGFHLAWLLQSERMQT